MAISLGILTQHFQTNPYIIIYHIISTTMFTTMFGGQDDLDVDVDVVSPVVSPVSSNGPSLAPLPSPWRSWRTMRTALGKTRPAAHAFPHESPRLVQNWFRMFQDVSVILNNFERLGHESKYVKIMNHQNGWFMMVSLVSWCFMSKYINICENSM